jgi:hypothetical protein
VFVLTPIAARIYSNSAVRAAAGITLVVLSANVSYLARELLAALLIFSVLFGMVVLGYFMLWFLEQGIHEAVNKFDKFIMVHLSGRAPSR